MSESVALCSEGGKFVYTTERRGVSEGEKEKNIQDVFKNEATPSSVFIQTNEIYKIDKQLLIQCLL